MRQDLRTQRLERRDIAKEGGLVGGQRLGDVAFELGGSSGLQAFDQLRHSGLSMYGSDGGEPRFGQVDFLGRKDNARLALDERAEEYHVRRHIRAPTLNRL